MELGKQPELISDINRVELKVYEVLKKVIDPEVGINIVDMGLVYTIQYKPEKGIRIEMTLTSKGCPLGESILSEVNRTLKVAFPYNNSEVILVWEPAWTTANISEAGKKMLGGR